MDKIVFQIIDANLNRTNEGLRVIEEVARFILCNKKLTEDIKAQRHKLAALFKEVEVRHGVPLLVKFRDTSKDLGRYGNFDNTSYKDLQEVIQRNLRRAQEGCRTIEEFSKLFSNEIPKSVKEIRFKIYDLEKEMIDLDLGRGSPAGRPYSFDFRFYVILDEKYINNISGPGSPSHKDRQPQGLSLLDIVRALCEGGAGIIQLREKTKNTKDFLKDALLVKKITSKFKIPFIVNDRVDIALAVQSEGVHLGETDMPVKYARQILRDQVEVANPCVIGCSVNTVSQAIKAEGEGASYVAIGALFPSKTKSKSLVPLSLISEIKSAVRIPVLGIGGITMDKIDKVLGVGADGICVAKDLFDYPNSSDLSSREQSLKERTQEFCKKCNRSY